MASGQDCICVAHCPTAIALKKVGLAARLFVPATLVPPGTERIVIDGDGFNHLVRVLRLQADDAFTIFDGQGSQVHAKILAVSAKSAEVSLGARETMAPSPASITLVQGVAKSDRMDLVIQKTTELGVAHIVPVLTSRVVVRLDAAAAEGKQRRWQAIAQEAARQCGRADVPTVDLPRSLHDALGRLAPAPRFALWETGNGQPLTTCLAHLPLQARAIQFLVGPEGGLAASEIAVAQAFHFVPVTLGPRILRTETAAIVAVTLAQAATGGLA